MALIVWDLTTGQPTQTMKGHKYFVTSGTCLDSWRGVPFRQALTCHISWHRLSDGQFTGRRTTPLRWPPHLRTIP